MLRKHYFVTAILAILFVATALALTWFVIDNQKAIKRGESREIAKNGLARLQVGMTREEVERTLGKDWKTRYKCDRTDVYLIGDSDPDSAAILYLDFRNDVGGTQVLDKIAGLDVDMLFQFKMCPVSFQ